MPKPYNKIFLSHCSVSPLVESANQAVKEFSQAQADFGSTMFRTHSYQEAELKFKNAAAKLFNLQTNSDISYIGNTASGLNMLAASYPFRPGDEVIVYEHEFPSNYFPWLIQARQRGVKLKLLKDCAGSEKPHAFHLSELEALITPATKVIAVSHVQFCSGFCVDLNQLSALCSSKGIDLVIDAAQSLGALKICPEELNLAAVVAPGWKWLRGPLGSGGMYTSKEFRAKLEPAHGGPYFGSNTDYLDLDWKPFQDARVFEFSTLPITHIEALAAAMLECCKQQKHPGEFEKIIKGQHDFLKAGLSTRKYRAENFDALPAYAGNTTILSVNCLEKSATQVVSEADSKGLILTERGGYLRLAPHYYQSEQDLHNALDVLNLI